ncbi:MAG: hypothetical protein KKF12_12510 [Proteobacteria bacterium]|nr:hypothetical protein [Desulfobacula sp.]MBU4131634.1 hypothetical protein [Pseudomonadota bacterium]
MTKLRNPKADILWEATRRNEDYKKEYYDALNKYQKEYPKQPRENFKRLPSPDSDRWQIKMGGTNPITKKICSFYWLDPDIQLEEIWDHISEQGNTWMHPYNHLFPDEKINEALTKNLKKKTGEKYGRIFLDSYYCSEMHGIVEFDNYRQFLEPQNISKEDLMPNDFFEFVADDTVYAAIKKEYTKDKILLMIDPFESDVNIQIKVKEIKDKVIQSLKIKAKILRTKGKILLEPSKMNSYFDWFKRYDEIIHEANKEESSTVVCINGANCLNTEETSSIDFGQLVPNSDIDEKKFDTGEKYDSALDKRIKADKKKYKTAYENSIQLIQQTPNIFFLPPKIKQKP